MNLSQSHSETLSLVIDFDQASGLPLLRESDKILKIILTYVALPYTIAEFGCGKKCSIILDQLVRMGVPAYALKRGMIMEKDMGNEMLEQKDYTKRPHALVLQNPLYHPKDFHQTTLLKMLEDQGIGVNPEENTLRAGEFILNHVKEIQFQKARSHVFTIVTFWDDIYDTTIDLVLDPTLNPNRLIDFDEIREVLSDDEALIFSASPLANFKLHMEALTSAHRRELKLINPNITEHQVNDPRVIRSLNKAEKNTLGDPETWTYANNLFFHTEQDWIQRSRTGQGDLFYNLLAEMIAARKERQGRVVHLRSELENAVDYLQVVQVIHDDALWSEKQLEPLAIVENTVSYYRALRQWLQWKDRGLTLEDIVINERFLPRAFGIAGRLRQRIETLAVLSRDAHGVLDARAFNPQYFDVVIELIQQMNLAGLQVYVDKVGNIHGVRYDHENNLQSVRNRALCICSHVDTVNDAGKFDGRLGVLSGIEVAHVLNDVETYFANERNDGMYKAPLIVTAYIGEEMTFTGHGVSMPGSAAVAGQAQLSEIYQMVNSEGETFEDKLVELLTTLSLQQRRGSLTLAIDLTSAYTTQDLLDRCLDPELFYTPHTYERHIEQGPVLDEEGIPLALVDTIMGIHQEDFVLSGEYAEQAALDMVTRMRSHALSATDDIRLTVGIVEGSDRSELASEFGFVVRVDLLGEKNHAGATRMQDRKDPVVGISRVSLYFREIVEEYNRKHNTDLMAVIGDVDINPGVNRNVIAASASVTLALINNQVSESARDYLMLGLQAFLVNHLSAAIEQGGEQISEWQMEPIQFFTRSFRTRFSIDLRAASDEAINGFRQKIQLELESLMEQYGLTMETKVHQEQTPFHLSRAGQVLQLERSFGGSHNPNEAELMIDLLRGTLLQLKVAENHIQEIAEGEILFSRVKSLLPSVWKPSTEPFVSGALHDTCNIAAYVLYGVPASQ